MNERCSFWSIFLYRQHISILFKTSKKENYIIGIATSGAIQAHCIRIFIRFIRNLRIIYNIVYSIQISKNIAMTYENIIRDNRKFDTLYFQFQAVKSLGNNTSDTCIVFFSSNNKSYVIWFGQYNILF